MTEEGPVRYSKKYYRENRKVLLERKRQRYLNDPEYREKIQAASKIRKNKILAERREDRAKNGLKARPIWFKLDVAGTEVPVRMYTAGQLAKKLGRKTQTIRVWEKKGILPVSLYRCANKNRLYTAFQVEGIIAAYNDAERDFGTNMASFRIASTNFIAAVKAIWDEHPLGIDEKAL